MAPLQQQTVIIDCLHRKINWSDTAVNFIAVIVANLMSSVPLQPSWAPSLSKGRHLLKLAGCHSTILHIAYSEEKNMNKKHVKKYF